MGERVLTIDGVTVPRFLYGTAWKEDDTERLTLLALRQGFRGVDTANQRKHYHEAGAGAAVRQAIETGLVTRDELFLQTNFTFRAGQDDRLPYDPKAPIATQVEQSVSSSLEHLGVDVIDSYVLHGPARRVELGAEDWEAWRAMETVHASGRARLLGVSNVTLEQLEALCKLAAGRAVPRDGVSNVTLEQLEALCKGAVVPPRFVQNRCYATHGWDRDVRAFCAANAIAYQEFSLLTANRAVLV